MRNSSVASRLVLINLVVSITFVVCCFVGTRAIVQQNEAFSRVGTLGAARRLLQNADMMHDTVRTDVFAALLPAEDIQSFAHAGAGNFKDDAQQFESDLVALSKIVLPDPFPRDVAAIQASTNEYLVTGAEVIRLAASDREAARTKLATFGMQFASLVEQMKDLTEVISQQITESEAQAHRRIEAIKLLLVSAIVISTLVSLFLASVTRSIKVSLASLKQVLGVAQSIASGQLTARCDVKRQDEVGELAGVINVMADELEQNIGNLRAESERNAFRSELGDALDLADDEPAVHELAARAMVTISKDYKMELLMSDSSRAHLHQSAVHPINGGPNCKVESPFNCTAVRRGYTMEFSDSESLKACRYLRNRADGNVCAVCVPMSFMGHSIGVLHVQGEAGASPGKHQVEMLSNLGAQLSGRIGTARAFSESQTKATTDSLTGLCNRRSMEERIHQLLIDESEFSFVLVDLDHFKKLNDEYGHQAGDAALRRFAHVAKQALGIDDVAARWGGEEFALLLPRATGGMALEICERIREELRSLAQSGNVPAFTASFGVAKWQRGVTQANLIQAADTALYDSKNSGRDRATCAVYDAALETTVRDDQSSGQHIARQRTLSVVPTVNSSSGTKK
jgi:diguanylate cyclase (GGDEF)-like protein